MKDRRSPTGRIAALTSVIVAADVGIGLALHGSDYSAVEESALALVALALLLVAAEYLLVSFRHGSQSDTWNLMEAALAPMLFGFAGPTAMVAVAVAQLVSGLLRRNTPLKLSFNVAQWVLATGVGSALLGYFGADRALPNAALATVAALAGVAIVNQLAMTVVLSIADATSPVRVLRQRGAELVPGALIGWSANVLLGLLFVFAMHAHVSAVVLFPAPLLALHIAYRAAAVTRIERVRHAGIQKAVRTLALPLHPAESIDAFVVAVGEAFDAPVACVATAQPGAELITHSSADGDGADALMRAVLAAGGAGHLEAGDGSPVGAALAAAGWRSCIYAVCNGGEVDVAIAVVDQEGFDNHVTRELVLVTGLARETLRIIEKGRLVRELDDERRSLTAIVSTTSDGIATIDADGVVRSWNPAFERLAAVDAVQTVGARGVFARLQARTLAGTPVDIDRWAKGGRLPRELRITAADGEPRRLMCSYSRALDDHTGSNVLVVVARDVTASEGMDALRAQFTRLVEAAPRGSADLRPWPQPLAPAAPVARTELTVDHFGASRNNGGVDPYDWYVLSDGHVHFVTIALTSHDARQMAQAIAAIERLRAVADEGVSFDALTEVADELFGVESGMPASAVVGRYVPDDGTVELTGVGGPTVMVVTPHDGVHELVLGRRGVVDLRLALGESIVITSVPPRPVRSTRRGGERSLVDLLDRMSHLPTSDLVAQVLAIRGALARPESLVFALRRTGVGGTRSWKVPPSVEAVGVFRREIVGWLRTQAVTGERLDDVAVVVSELLTNAVGSARTSVEVHALLDTPTLEVAVSDDGVGFEVALDEVPDVEDLFAESGRGLHIVDALASTWTVRAGSDGATVRAQLCVGPESPATVSEDVMHPALVDRNRTTRSMS